MGLRTMAEIRTYVDSHRLRDELQASLQHVVNEMPAEPLLVLSKYFAMKHEEAVKAAYDDSAEDVQKIRMPLGDIFMQFDSDDDGVLDLGEFKRALRALGLPKREGRQAELDEFTFKTMDTNGDGKLSMEEFDANLPLALRAKIEKKLEEGWKFDKEKWNASQERHAQWNMAKVFKQFDHDGDGKLSMEELKRAFRAIGLQKRTGEKFEMDETMFKIFDTDGDAMVSVVEFENNIPAAVRAKLIEKLETGWKFNPDLWAVSTTNHARTNFAKVFKKFDSDDDGFLDFRELQRAFRAIGLKKRSGAHYELDAMVFKTFDANGDGKVSLQEFDQNMPDALREKLAAIIDGGWTFDPSLWESSLARHVNDDTYDPAKALTNTEPIEAKFPMGEIFLQFDSDSDGVLDMGEFKRALRAIGLPKREGDKTDLDELTFSQMNSSGSGKLSVEEFDANLPLALRAKIEKKLEEGWKFDEEKWKASQERHSNWNMAKVFKQFDSDGDGKLSMAELKRAFRAIGLKKRSGEKIEMDEQMFASFDTNGDGVVSVEEFQANLYGTTRAKIEEKLNTGWKYDEAKWKASQLRHSKPNYAKIFKKFDADSDGSLDMRELQRAYRAMGLSKRTGEKAMLDQMSFKAMDADGDGKVSLEEFEANMPQPLRDTLDEAIAGGWTFDEEKWQASLTRHANDEAYDDSKAYT